MSMQLKFNQSKGCIQTLNRKYIFTFLLYTTYTLTSIPTLLQQWDTYNYVVQTVRCLIPRTPVWEHDKVHTVCPSSMQIQIRIFSCYDIQRNPMNHNLTFKRGKDNLDSTGIGTHDTWPNKICSLVTGGHYKEVRRDNACVQSVCHAYQSLWWGWLCSISSEGQTVQCTGSPRSFLAGPATPGSETKRLGNGIDVIKFLWISSKTAM